MSTLADEMKSRLASYVNQQSSLDQFEDWFGRASFEARKAKDSEAESLGYAVEWLFFDLEHGGDSAAVRKALASLVGNRVVLSKVVAAAGAEILPSLNESFSTFRRAEGAGSFGRSQILRETEHDLQPAP